MKMSRDSIYWRLLVDAYPNFVRQELSDFDCGLNSVKFGHVEVCQDQIISLMLVVDIFHFLESFQAIYTEVDKIQVYFGFP